MWTQNIFCQWQNRHYELHWSMNPSLFLAVEKALRVHSIHSRSTWGPRASERWNYNSSLMPVLKGLPLPWVTPHEEDVILAGCYQLCKLKTWKISSSKRIIKNWGNLASSETLWQACKVFIFPATISMLENQEWGKWFLLFFFFPTWCYSVLNAEIQGTWNINVQWKNWSDSQNLSQDSVQLWLSKGRWVRKSLYHPYWSGCSEYQFCSLLLDYTLRRRGKLTCSLECEMRNSFATQPRIFELWFCWHQQLSAESSFPFAVALVLLKEE